MTNYEKHASGMTAPTKILLVDDDLVILSGLAQHLEAAGYAVVSASVMPENTDDISFCVALKPVQTSLSVIKAIKPIRLGPLLARIHDEAKRQAQLIRVKGWVIDPERKTAQRGRKLCRLTDKEAQLLCVLAQGNGLTRDNLLAQIWGYQDGIDTHTLETHIYTLRRKLDDVPNAPEIILLENGIYSLNPSP